MRVVGFCGPSGAGKTTLIERLLPCFRARGLRVSVIKHAHSGFDIDRPGKDSWRHRQAGAYEVLLASDRRVAKLREFELAGPPTVHQLLAELNASDGVAVVAVLHDLTSAALYFGRVAFLRAGRLVAAGPPAAVIEEATIRQVFDVDVRVWRDGDVLVVHPRSGRPKPPD